MNSFRICDTSVSITLEAVVSVLDCNTCREGEKKVRAISTARRVVILVMFPVSVSGDSVWPLSIILASVAIEVVPSLEGKVIVAAQTMGDTSTDDPLVGVSMLTTVLSSPATEFAVLGGVETTVGSDVSGAEETDLESPQESWGIPAIPDFGASLMLEGVSSPQIVVGVCLRSSSTAIVQLCDGKEDRSGDGGGDHATEG